MKTAKSQSVPRRFNTESDDTTVSLRVELSIHPDTGRQSLAQLDDVHSILRLSYETLKGLASLASRGVAKLTLCETARRSEDRL